MQKASSSHITDSDRDCFCGPQRKNIIFSINHNYLRLKEKCVEKSNINSLGEYSRSRSNSLFIECWISLAKTEETQMQKPHNLQKGYLNDAKYSPNTNRSLINGLTANEAHLNSLKENVIFKLN